jgi:hypothetical protein
VEAAADRIRAASPTVVLAVPAYALFGGLLLVTRLYGLDRSYASDELMTVRRYIRAGPGEILAGAYIPNNHELFSLLGWLTTTLVGESAVALRLWSAVPFILGVLIVTAWLHARMNALAGVLFLFLATAAPLLLDITRQARGYGLAFLASVVLTLTALEAIRSPQTALVVSFCAAGIAGTWTLPNFAIVFAATAVPLLTVRQLRRQLAAFLPVSVVSVFAWYSPQLGEILETSRQDYARPIETAWLLSAPLDQTLLPALRGIDEVLVNPDLASLAAVVVLALVMAASPLLGSWRSALVLTGGTLASVGFFWATQTSVAPRFLSFLFVPLGILLATGGAGLCARFPNTPLRAARAALLALTVATVASVASDEGWRILRLPREATADAAAVIREGSPPETPVYAYVPYPRDLEYYLGRQVERPRTPRAALQACTRRAPTVVVTQPWILSPLSRVCTGRAQVRRTRLEQYARGRHIDVWFVPPRR